LMTSKLILLMDLTTVTQPLISVPLSALMLLLYLSQLMELVAILAL